MIDGKVLAERILTNLERSVTTIKKRGIVPTIAVILVGNDPGSLSYIKQKRKAAERIGANLRFEHLPETISPDILEGAIAHFNNDTTVHGLIVQRPIPPVVGDVTRVLNTVSAAKDIDGFIEHSPFEVPVARAVIAILNEIHKHLTQAVLTDKDFKAWLNSQPITIIGRGETAGRPIATLLETYGCVTNIVHSNTKDPDTILKNSSVIISCVGKEHIITRGKIRTGAILIAVGLWRDKEGKIHGDYEADDIKDKASFYTPTPGGVGPLNVACLMQNLIESATLSLK